MFDYHSEWWWWSGRCNHKYKTAICTLKEKRAQYCYLLFLTGYVCNPDTHAVIITLRMILIYTTPVFYNYVDY